MTRVATLNWMRSCMLGCGVVGVLALQACGAPGFAKLEGARDPSRERTHVLGYRPVQESAPVDDDAPVGAITPISPALIRAQLQSRPTEIPSDVRQLFGIAPMYTIGPGDVLGISVYDHPELLPNAGGMIASPPASDPTVVNLVPGFLVDANGELAFPYVGKIKLGGLTEIQASELVTRRIATYIRDPQVNVRIQSFRSRRAYIEGEVKTPGLQVFTDIPMTLAEAISRAGGITISGDRSFVTLTRNNKTTLINLQFLQETGADASRIPLQSGDIINVRNREDSKVYVMGEILRPSALLMRNGKLSLNEALGEAGGPNLATANPGQIYVIRNAPNGSPSIFHLDAKNPAALGLADRFALAPRDVVYVDPVPLVEWSRLINLIVPAASVINYGSETISR